MKSQVRKRIKEIICTMPPEIARIKSQSACAAALGLPEFAAARTVMLYVPMSGEADCTAIAEECWRSGRTVLVPRIDWEPRQMIAVKIDSFQRDIAVGDYGIPRPVGSDPWPLERIDWVVVPALAYDRRGHRLGRGGGFYDRFLAQGGLRAVFCGLGFGEQVVDRLPNHPHDQPVAILVTDREVLRFPKVAAARPAASL